MLQSILDHILVNMLGVENDNKETFARPNEPVKNVEVKIRAFRCSRCHSSIDSGRPVFFMLDAVYCSNYCRLHRTVKTMAAATIQGAGTDSSRRHTFQTIKRYASQEDKSEVKH